MKFLTNKSTKNESPIQVISATVRITGDKGELVTYEKLQILGIDSVRIDKISDLLYEINFASGGSYDNFMELNLL